MEKRITEKAGLIIKDYLKKYPQCTEAWLLLATIECNPPLEMADEVAKYINPILEYDPTNAYALLLLAHAQYYFTGIIEPETYEKLCSIKNESSEVMAMVEVAKARYFEGKNILEYEKAIKKSIEYSSEQTTNFSMLGKLYLEQGKIVTGKQMIKKGLNNVKKIITVADAIEQDYDPVSIENLFDYYYKGIEMMEFIHNELKWLSE